ncbi:DUF2339 domain-containing protein [Chryseobacterium sp. LC2016-29]|uniref:DUF2339 domain-containing protein n=1 Tax=Chryseobacterium sp. LC2016-29 TaxID=2897331 RepID=UPI001E2DD685|nr:DUF2339 domain-containing protein [Chryseobacterium sp. LC2016-29]MCD0479177.1 DUF2339 domain-containing protein [Chryseobacterium sp. LC2016-29]
MIYALITILIVLIVLVYQKLNRKIQILEQKINNLSKDKIKTEQPINISKETVKTETLPSGRIDIEQKPIPETVEDNLESEKDWLTPFFDFIKQNILTIIGIFTLVLGIGYFVKYAIDKNWIGESARMGIGFLAGFILIITAHFIRKNYTIFSSIIMGGGIAVLYFTTTIAFREYHLFTQNTAFVITCAITLLSIFLSYHYNSETLIIFSLFGGFLAPLMISTGQSNYIFLFTYLSLLNIGMLVTVYLKNWKSVGWIAFVFTAIYLYFWTIEKTDLTSIIFYIITYIVFYAFALQNYLKTNLLSKLDILMLVLVNFSSIIGLVYIFSILRYEPLSIFPLSFALINIFFAFREHQNKKIERNYSVFAGIGISLLTLAVALQFKTHLITSVWAIEAALLLYIWKKTSHSIFKIFFYLLFPLVILSQIMTWTEYINNEKHLTIVFNPVFLTSLVVIASCFFNLILLKKESKEKSDTDFFENAFKVLCFGVIYLSVLFELIYQLSSLRLVIIITYSFLYSIVFISLLLILKKIVGISKTLENILIYVLLLLYIAHISSSQIVYAVINREIGLGLYGIYLLYLVPLFYLIIKLVPQSEFLKEKISYWIISLVCILSISFELYRMYIFSNNILDKNISQYQEHFSILYLPIIWAILSCGFIFAGLKKNIPELNKIGFGLLGITILKLYLYDVWQMDNVSRIIAFIILGIILLLSSFMFQKFKNMLKNLVEKNENSIDGDI